MARSRLVLCFSALITAGLLALTGCAEGEIEIPVQPLPEPTEPEVTEPEVRSLSWYTEQVWNEHARVEQAEDIIAGCMAFNGFEYIPEVGDAPRTDQIDMQAERDRAEREGFGIVREYVAGLADVDPVMTGPNAAYFEDLGPDEQQAYRDALEGTQENGFEGCRSEAQLFTMNTDPSRVYQDDAFRELVTELGALPEQVAADARAVNIESQWAACMHEQGYTDLSGRNDIEAQLAEAFAVITDPSEEQLDEFQDREIEAATADITCAVTVEWFDVMTDIEASYAERFVDEHRDELEALVDKYGV